MEIIYSPKAQIDILYWQKSGQNLIKQRISKIINDIEEHPESGIGKPEKLKYELSGFWSRKINDKHGIIYKFNENTVYIYSLKGHY